MDRPVTDRPSWPDHLAPPPGQAQGDRVRYAACPVVAEDGYRTLTLDLWVPAGATPQRPVPVVLYLYGGGWKRGSNTFEWDRHAAEICDALIGAGFAMALGDYRHSGEATWPAQLHDVKAAVRWLRQFGPGLGLDADRLAAWGSSSGGHLAVLLGSTDGWEEGARGVTGPSSAVGAVVDWFGPTEVANMPASAVIDHDHPGSPESRLLGAPPKSVPLRATEASPTTHVHAGSAPLLIQHGDADLLVPVQQAELLAAAYRAAGAPCTLEVVAGGAHDFDNLDVAPLVERVVGFLRSSLGGAAASDLDGTTASGGRASSGGVDPGA